MNRRTILFLSFLFGVFFCVPTGTSRAADFYGTAPTGLLELENKYPYYLFVPPDYTPEKGWPLVVLLGGTADEPKEVMNQWADWAKKNQVLLLVGTVYVRENSLPQLVDDWYLRIKKEVSERYHIASSQILLVGIEAGAQYAAYLALEHPEEFSAAALFRRAWPGPLQRMTKTTTNPKRQVPFYVAVDPEGEIFPAVEAKASELEKKGYQITFDSLKTGEDLSSHRDRMIQWFLQGTEARSLKVQQKSKRGMKGTLQEMKKNMFGK